jgi:hypothetical protein
MYNLTIHIDTDSLTLIPKLLVTLFNLPFPTAPRYNAVLNELTVLCELSHAAEVERILAPYV